MSFTSVCEPVCRVSDEGGFGRAWPLGHAQPVSRVSGKTDRSRGVEGDAENAKYHCEQRTDSNQHPSSSVEGYVEGVKRALDESMSLKKGSSGVIQRHQLSLAESRVAEFFRGLQTRHWNGFQTIPQPAHRKQA